jgi:hypothetical protein
MPSAPAIARAGNVRHRSQNGKANTVRTNHTYCTNTEVLRVLSLLQGILSAAKMISAYYPHTELSTYVSQQHSITTAPMLRRSRVQ